MLGGLSLLESGLVFGRRVTKPLWTKLGRIVLAKRARGAVTVASRLAVLTGLWLLPLGAAQQIAERSTPELLRYGAALYERGECFSSRYLFQQVLERDPENLEALAGKGRALVCEGSFDEGVAALEQLTRLAPERPGAFTQLASAYLSQYGRDPETYAGRLDDALAALDRAEAGAPNAATANLRGVVYYRRGDLPAARDALERAVTLNDNVAEYHRDLGLVYIQQSNIPEAIRTLRRAVALEPDDALGRNQLGQAYLLAGRCDDAVFELEQALTLAPNLAVVNLNLGVAQFDCENLTAARPLFEKVVALEPTLFPPAYTYLARLELEAGNFDGAVTQATKGTLLLSENAEAYYWLGEAYAARGDTGGGEGDDAKAEEAYRRALELDASYRPARDALNTP